MSDKDFEKLSGADYDYKAAVLDEKIHTDPNTNQKISIRDAISHYKTPLWQIDGFMSLGKAGETYAETLKRFGFDNFLKFSEMFTLEFASYLNPEDLRILDDLVERFRLFFDANTLTIEQAKEITGAMYAVIYKYVPKSR